MHDKKNKQTLAIFLGILGVACFSGTVPATSVAVKELNPWFITFARASIAGVLAIITLLITRRTLEREHWKTIFISSICLVFGYPGFLALALLSVPATHSGVVLGLLPLATAGLAVFLTNERPSRSFWLWSLLGAILVLIFTFQDGNIGFSLGDLWLLAATFSAALGYVLSGKLSKQKPGWEIICWQLLMIYPLLLAGTWYFWDATILNAEISTYAGFLYVSFISMYLAFFPWNAGLSLGGIARIGQLQLFQTFFILFAAWFVLGEPLNFSTIFFAAAILLIVWKAQRSRIDNRQEESLKK